MIKAPRPTPEPQRADYSDIAQVHERLREASEALSGMVDSVAQARTVKEFSAEQRKRLLSIPMREFLVAGESAASAETKARASSLYGEELQKFFASYAAAEAVISKHDSLTIQWKTAQSILSSLKTIAGQV